MKKTSLYIIMVMAAILFTACHSNEQNYQEAYEKAVERRKTGVGAEDYAKIEAERQRYTHVINGDSVRMLYVNVNVAIDSTAEVHPYSVVVASFAQRINAKSYCDRLREECHLPGYILYGGPEKKYFVVAQGFETSGEAAGFIHDIGKKVCLKVLEPLPWILCKL